MNNERRNILKAGLGAVLGFFGLAGTKQLAAGDLDDQTKREVLKHGWAEKPWHLFKLMTYHGDYDYRSPESFKDVPWQFTGGIILGRDAREALYAAQEAGCCQTNLIAGTTWWCAEQIPDDRVLGWPDKRTFIAGKLAACYARELPRARCLVRNYLCSPIC